MILKVTDGSYQITACLASIIKTAFVRIGKNFEIRREYKKKTITLVIHNRNSRLKSVKNNLKKLEFNIINLIEWFLYLYNGKP